MASISVVLVVTLGVLLAGCAVVPEVDWPQFGQDAAHTNFNASEASIGLGNVATLASAWTAKATGLVSIQGQDVVVAGERVYVAVEDSVEVYSRSGVTNCAGTPTQCEPLFSAHVGSQVYGSPLVA